MSTANLPAVIPAQAGNQSLDARWQKWLALSFFPAYLLLVATAVGVRAEHLIASGLCLGLIFAGEKAQRFVFLILPGLMLAVVYEVLLPLGLRYRGPVHVADLYQAELSWFSISLGSTAQTLPEFFANHHWPAVDLVCGLVYMAYIPEMVVLAICLYFRDQRRLSQLMWACLLVHILGFTTQVLYPAAPPWYVQQYGLGPAAMDAVSNPAGVARIDELLGIGLAKEFYSHSTNVFGAMPSMHVASPTVFALLVFAKGRRWAIPTALFALIMAFGAVYFRHHYVLDVLAGIAYACLASGTVVAVDHWLRLRAERHSIAEQLANAPVRIIRPQLAPGRLVGS